MRSLIPKLGCTVRSEKAPVVVFRPPVEVAVPGAWWRGSIPPTSPLSRKLLELRSFPETVIQAGAAPDLSHIPGDRGWWCPLRAQSTMALPG